MNGEMLSLVVGVILHPIVCFSMGPILCMSMQQMLDLMLSYYLFEHDTFPKTKSLLNYYNYYFIINIFFNLKLCF